MEETVVYTSAMMEGRELTWTLANRLYS